MQNGSIEYPMNGTAALAPRKTASNASVAKIIQFPGAQNALEPSRRGTLDYDARIDGSKTVNNHKTRSTESITLKDRLIEIASYSEMITSLRYDGLSGIHFSNVSKQDKVIGVVTGIISTVTILALGM